MKRDGIRLVKQEQLQLNKAFIEQTVEKHRQDSLQETTIVAVTKTVPHDVNRQLFELGQTHFGENRVDTLVGKLDALADIQSDITWHFIGNLQTRQVKKIINQIDYLHSLDRLSLAKEIQKRAKQPVKCFLQVNVSGEESKSGFTPSELDNIIKELAEFDKVSIVGLMTMAPIDATDSELADYFSQLKALQVEVQKANYTNAPCTQVSMGMSQDYPIAVAQGATFVRVGTAFFENAL